MSKQLVELVNLWAAYEDQTNSPSLTDFCAKYLATHHQNVFKTDNEQQLGYEIGQESPLTQQNLVDGELGALMGRLTRFVYFYSKKAVDKMSLNSLDDVLYLHLMMEMNAPKKSELIYALLSEFASGIDIINRLLKMGLCVEFPDENDRRAKRVRITPKGIEALAEASPIMSQISKIAFNELDDVEKKMMINILRRADRFHTDHYGIFRNEDFDDIYNQVIK
jgi:MarR family transcriptional regulator, lower aerobic nicotinate degradation pathway regulator